MQDQEFTIIIPAYNEGKTVAHVVKEALETPGAKQVIVVDDGSTDSTQRSLKQFQKNAKCVVVRHEKNRGKGAALKTGLLKATTEVVLFLDADLTNITAKKIATLAKPVLTNKVDMTRAKFRRARGRVTTLTVRPMMKILFPDRDFEQPITGQICGKKSFFETLDLDTRWGVDIGILLDAIEAGQRIQEVDIGYLEHKANAMNELAEMARQVLETMVKKSGLIQHKYRLVIFTIDNTLIQENAIRKVFDALGLRKEVEELQRKYRNDALTFSQFMRQIAKLLKGRKIEELEEATKKVKLTKYAKEVIRSLRRRKYRTALVSSNFHPIVATIARELGIDDYEAIRLEVDRKGVLTGKVSKRSAGQWSAKTLSDSLVRASRRLAQRGKVRLRETVIVANSPRIAPLFDKIGLSLAYRPKSKELRDAADKTISVLAEVLALVE